jgi:hypothetical protein
MAITTLLKYIRLASVDGLQAVLNQYTCPIDGFVHAHQDEFDPLLIFVEESCPVDAVRVAMQPIVAGLVTEFYNQTDTIINPFERNTAIIQSVRTAMADWLTTHTRDDIADFLNVEVKIRARIINTMINQGILVLVS